MCRSLAERNKGLAKMELASNPCACQPANVRCTVPCQTVVGAAQKYTFWSNRPVTVDPVLITSTVVV